MGHTRVAPEYARIVQACTCPCPATSTQSTRVALPHPRRIRRAVGLRLYTGSAPTSCQDYCQVTRGWSTVYTLVTPWSRPRQGVTRLHSRNARCTAGPHPGRAAVMHKSRPEYTRPLPGNTWETPQSAPGPCLASSRPRSCRGRGRTERSMIAKTTCNHVEEHAVTWTRRGPADDLADAGRWWCGRGVPR